MPLTSFHTNWKHQKARAFMLVSGGMVCYQWHEMVQTNVFILNKLWYNEKKRKKTLPSFLWCFQMLFQGLLFQYISHLSINKLLAVHDVRSTRFLLYYGVYILKMPQNFQRGYNNPAIPYENNYFNCSKKHAVKNTFSRVKCTLPLSARRRGIFSFFH